MAEQTVWGLVREVLSDKMLWASLIVTAILVGGIVGMIGLVVLVF